MIKANKTNYTVGRSGRKVEMIAIHHMAGVLSAKRCGDIFKQANRGGSAHYGIGKNGEVEQYVSEKDTAWTNSNWDANCKSITIECSNSKRGGDWLVGDKTLNSLIKLVADISKRYKIKLVKGKTVVWHRMYSKTTCPGNYLLSKMDYIIKKANEINNPPKKPVVKKKSVTEIAKEVIAGKWGNGSTRKTKLTKAGYNYNEVQKMVNKLVKKKKAVINFSAIQKAVNKLLK